VVQEGHVRVQQAVTPGREASMLAEIQAGEVATIDHGGSTEISRIEPARISRKLDWRDGTLMFDGDSLEQVVREVSRYTSVNIVIEDAALREQRFGGYFRVGEVEDLLGTLESDYGVRVSRVSVDEVRLTTISQ
jgi:transmembrane sensor